MVTQRTDVSIDSFLESVSDKRRVESTQLIALMQKISGEIPYMWGPSIIAFGSIHYKYDTGREGDMPRLAFSPRSASLTIYFDHGFAGKYAQELTLLGKHKSSKACLYINKLEDINLDILGSMLERSFAESVAQSN